jgi:diguanylate cyclase (GGDEF)-like protein
MNGKKFRLNAFATLAFLVVSICYWDSSRAFWLNDTALGFNFVGGSGETRIALVVPNLPADKSGILPGDVVLSVDGVQINTEHDYDSARLKFEAGKNVQVIIKRMRNILVLTVKPGVPTSWYSVIAAWLTPACFLGLILVALFYSDNDFRAYLLAILSTSMAIQFILPLELATSAWINHWSWLLFYMLSALSVGVGLHLSSMIPEPSAWFQERRWMIKLFYALPFFVAFMNCTTYVTQQIFHLRLFPWRTEQADLMIYDRLWPLWLSFVIAMLISQIMTANDKAIKYKSILLLFSLLPILIVLGLDMLLFQVLHLPRPPWSLFPYPMLAIPFLATLASLLLRNARLDFEYLARIGVVYISLASFLALSFYAVFSAGLSRIGKQQESMWSLSVSMLVIGLLFSPLQRHIERRFFPQRYALRQELLAISSEMLVNVHDCFMSECLMSRLRDACKARLVSLLFFKLGRFESSEIEGRDVEVFRWLLQNNGMIIERFRQERRFLSGRDLAGTGLEKYLDKDTFIFPLASQHSLLGVLVLAGRHGRRPYSRDELDTLYLFSQHVATTLANIQLFQSATREGLTGLLRREFILEQLTQSIKNALSHGLSLSVLMADLDHFKRINDLHGHLVGDAVLRHSAQAMSGELRSYDFVGRYGGEEFLFILPGTGLSEAITVAERVRSAVQNLIVNANGGLTVHATVSIGVASLEQWGYNSGSPTSGELIALADRLLYKAKKSGRNQVCAHPTKKIRGSEKEHPS